MLRILLEVIAPVFILMLVGYLVEKWRALDARTITTLALYLLNPALTFRSVLTTTLSLESLAKIALFVLLLAVGNYWAAWLAARWGKIPSGLKDAFVVTVLFMNSGHFGIPVNFFAFGQEGFDMAVMFMVLQSCLTNSLAVFLMSREKATAGEALRNVVRMPLLYAFLLGAALRAMGWLLPVTIMKAVNLLAEAAIPVSLLMIGIQLAKTGAKEGRLLSWSPVTWWEERNRPVFLASFLRLVVAPLTGWCLVRLTGLSGTLGRVLVVEAGAPVAVMTTLLAVEFDNQAEFTSKTILVSTLGSVITVTTIIHLLG